MRRRLAVSEVPRSPDGKYQFTITVNAQGCPIAAKASLQNCDPPPGSTKPPEKCARVLKGDLVEFKAVNEDGTPSAAALQLQFDPFKKGMFKAPAGGMKIDVYGAGDKAFTFNVFSDPPGNCPNPYDPQIIVD